MKWLNGGLFAANLAFFGVVVWLVSAHGAAYLEPGSWKYEDLVSILLSVVSVLVTGIGIVIAVAAIWGFQSLRSLAEQKAEETSRAGFTEYLGSDTFKQQIDAALKARIEHEAREAVQNALGPAVLPADVAPEFQQGDQEWRD